MVKQDEKLKKSEGIILSDDLHDTTKNKKNNNDKQWIIID